MIDLEHLKALLVTVLSSVLAFIEPAGVTLALVFSVAVIDILVGYRTGKAVNGERWNHGKFTRAMTLTLVYLGIVLVIYTIGALQGDKAEVLYVEKMITYVFIYFYAKNILKNLRLRYPDSRQIAALDDMLDFEFLKRIPWAGKILKNNGNVTEINEDSPES